VYRQRYPSASSRMMVIENGYDEDSFVSVAPNAESDTGRPLQNKRPMIMLHSGIVYPSERDPTQLFEALGRLQREGALTPADLRVRFRASVHDDLLRALAKANDALDFVELCPAIPYREALAEMLAVDVLLVMQASNCNAQIPAKIYEYLRAGKPILGLTDPAGDTAGVLRHAGLNYVASLDSVDDIVALLTAFVRDWRQGRAVLPQQLAVQESSRARRSQALARLLDQTFSANSVACSER
jgi:hypothetical protein